MSGAHTSSRTVMLHASRWGGAATAFAVSEGVADHTARWLQRGQSVVQTIVDLLPTDVMDSIFLLLFKTWPLATYLLRVSFAFAALATRARRELPPGEWWTGSGLPLVVPAMEAHERVSHRVIAFDVTAFDAMSAEDLRVLRDPSAFAVLGVHGSARGDVSRTLLGVRALSCQTKRARTTQQRAHTPHSRLAALRTTARARTPHSSAAPRAVL